MRGALLVLALALVGCDQCGGPEPIAELRAAVGEVTLDDAPLPVAFVPATVGHGFVLDEAIHTAAGATADLTMAGGGGLHVDPETTVRFSRHSERARVVVESGTATVEAGPTAPLEFETSFGTAHIEAGGRARLGGADAGRFEVLVGRARLESEGTAVDLVAGGSSAPLAPEVTEPVAPPSTEMGASENAVLRDVEVRGAAASVRTPDAEAFVTLAVGSSRVAEGSVLRGSEGTTLDIPTANGRVRVEGASEVRLTPGAVALTRGSAAVEGSEGTRIELSGGALVLRGPASADVDIDTDGSGTITMRSGEARHEGAGGERTLSAPDVVALAAPLDSGSDSEGADSEGGPSEGASAEASEESADVALSAGESIAIHDPRGRTAVRLSPPSGCGEARFRFEGPRHPAPATSLGPLVVSLRPGTFRYRVTCASGPALSGSIRLDRDAGRASLPRTAPRTVVDADGRSYSVLYQTLLPEIVVRWPRAAAGSYELEVRRGSSSRRIRLSSASHTFSSGELPEGRHTLVFHGGDGSSSPATSVVIRFDNTTPVATIRSPSPTEVGEGSVHVAGTAAERARVSVGGQALSSDAAGRFEGDVSSSGGCIAIRVDVEGRGTHYYLRCRRNG